MKIQMSFSSSMFEKECSPLHLITRCLISNCLNCIILIIIRTSIYILYICEFDVVDVKFWEHVSNLILVRGCQRLCIFQLSFCLSLEQIHYVTIFDLGYHKVTITLFSLCSFYLSYSEYSGILSLLYVLCQVQYYCINFLIKFSQLV